MYQFKKNITIHNIYTSIAHNYFTRQKFHPQNNATIEHTTVHIKANHGLENDRFENSKYPITFISLEVATEVSNTLKIELDLTLFRRNIVVSGLNLNQLIGEKFKIGDIEFQGISHCAPCTWMNHVMKKGAYNIMKGRGGLRAVPLKNGVLEKGENIISTKNELYKDPLESLKTPNIPSL